MFFEIYLNVMAGMNRITAKETETVFLLCDVYSIYTKTGGCTNETERTKIKIY